MASPLLIVKKRHEVWMWRLYIISKAGFFLMGGVWGFGFFLLSGLTGISLDTFVLQINFHPYQNSVQLMTSLTWRGKSVPPLNLCAKTCFYLLDLNSLPFSFEQPSALQDKDRPSTSTFVVLFDSKLFLLILFSNLNNSKFSLHSLRCPSCFSVPFPTLSKVNNDLGRSHTIILYHGTRKFSIPSPPS